MVQCGCHVKAVVASGPFAKAHRQLRDGDRLAEFGGGDQGVAEVELRGNERSVPRTEAALLEEQSALGQRQCLSSRGPPICHEGGHQAVERIRRLEGIGSGARL
jgi:hypothetical protein